MAANVLSTGRMYETAALPLFLATSGMLQLQFLRLSNLSSLGIDFQQLMPFINEPARASGGLTSISLEGLDLQGTVPEELFNNSRWVCAACM